MFYLYECQMVQQAIMNDEGEPTGQFESVKGNDASLIAQSEIQSDLQTIIDSEPTKTFTIEWSDGSMSQTIF